MPRNTYGHSRRSIRLKGYDYSQTGAYFITICTHKGLCVLGDIRNGVVQLNDFGRIVEREWLRTDGLRENVVMDEYVVMPNHIHGIIVISNDGRGTLQRAPTVEHFGRPVSNSIPTIVRLFKSTTTKQINRLRNASKTSIWQRNYYEHVIRNEDDLNEIGDI